MGYYTQYSLSVHSLPKGMPRPTDVEEELVKFLSTDGGDSYSPFDYSCKWYDHEEDMKNFSKLHPEIVYCLSGIGEEFGDFWRKYFKDGKMQTVNAKITYEDFDSNKLT